MAAIRVCLFNRSTRVPTQLKGVTGLPEGDSLRQGLVFNVKTYFKERHLKLSKNLSDFNLRMVGELQGTFTTIVQPFETEDGTLVFRGPIDGHADPSHVGTHVAVSLDNEVHAAIHSATPEEREEIIQVLQSNLGTQVKCLYHPQKIGTNALEIVGTMKTLGGLRG
jgi:hypothetical protein